MSLTAITAITGLTAMIKPVVHIPPLDHQPSHSHNHSHNHSHTHDPPKGLLVRVSRLVERSVAGQEEGVEEGQGVEEEGCMKRGGVRVCTVPLLDKSIRSSSRHDEAMRGDCSWWGWEKDGGTTFSCNTPYQHKL